jgi:hypothetical protein
MSDLTPNVVVENPTVRKYMQIILSVVGLVLSSALVLDSQMPGVDWSSWINPSYALYGFLAATYGLAVISPNIPKHHVEKPVVVIQEVTEDGPRG